MTDLERSTPRTLVLGCTGMLGNAVMRVFSQRATASTWGTARTLPRHLGSLDPQQILVGVNVEDFDSLVQAVARAKPEVIINCVGLVKQLDSAGDPLKAIPINSLLPHRLARLAQATGARLIHVSTDCVFSGRKGMYLESDPADAEDLYGRSKYLGEVDYPESVTLRTSIIGHELNSAHGLVNWFLAQKGQVNGYTKAVFSGLPTVELARVMRDVVIPQPQLHGVYHVSSEPISKHDLLTIVAREYGRDNPIVPDAKLIIDRSLDSSRFRQDSGYSPPDWPQLVRLMRDFG